MLKNGIIWIVGLVIALAAGLSAVGAVTKNTVPQLAVTLRPLNGFASEKLASDSLRAAVARNSGQFPNNADPVAANFAKQAFLSEPITPEAIAVLALGRIEPIKRKLMHEAFALSRRRQLVNGWLTTDSGLQQDVSGIINYYDIMLRTSSASTSVVIPVMAGALSNEHFIEPFADLLSNAPPWTSQFWAAVAADPEAIVSGAKLRKLVYRKDENRDVYRDADLISALINNQHFETAEKLYDLLSEHSPHSDLLRNSSFAHEPIFAPLDWQLFSTGGYGSAIIKGNLQLSAIQNSGGLLARQLVNIPATIVEIRAKTTDIIPDDANLTVSLACAEQGNKTTQSIKIRLKEKSTRRQISNQRTGCRYYWFDLSGRAAESGDGFDVDLESISLRLK